MDAHQVLREGRTTPYLKLPFGSSRVTTFSSVTCKGPFDEQKDCAHCLRCCARSGGTQETSKPKLSALVWATLEQFDVGAHDLPREIVFNLWQDATAPCLATPTTARPQGREALAQEGMALRYMVHGTW